MSKSSSIKEAIGRFEKENNVVANEAEKVCPGTLRAAIGIWEAL